jgi:hypothetical protein
LSLVRAHFGNTRRFPGSEAAEVGLLGGGLSFVSANVHDPHTHTHKCTHTVSTHGVGRPVEEAETAWASDNDDVG